MEEKNLIISYMSIFIGVVGIIFIGYLIFRIEKKDLTNKNKESILIYLASAIGIVSLAILFYSSLTIYVKIKLYNEELYEMNIDNQVFKEERKIYTDELKNYQEKLKEYNYQIKNGKIAEKPEKPKELVRPETPDFQGTLGDLFGGVFAPAVGLIGVFAGGLAFYAQYKANQDIKDQFKLQQFESQFYEMLALHKDNINEMKIEGYEFDEDGKKQKKDTTGRKIFVSMNTELLCIYNIIKKIYLIDSHAYKVNRHKVNIITLIKLSVKSYVSINSAIKNKTFNNKKIILITLENSNSVKNSSLSWRKEIFILAYHVFFHSIEKTEFKYFKDINSRYLYDDLKKIFNNDNLICDLFLKNVFYELKRIRNNHYDFKLYNQDLNYNTIQNYFTFPKKIEKEFNGTKNLDLLFNYEPFDGHQSRLGHYYRHLFSMVNHVVKQEGLSYEEKRDYLKILRAQFSIYELTLLFYNYYSGYGNNWENKYTKPEEKIRNSFFLDYRFLHNIEDDYRFHDIKPSEILQDIIENQINAYKQDSNKNKLIMSKKGCDLSTDPIFELYKNIKEVNA